MKFAIVFAIFFVCHALAQRTTNVGKINGSCFDSTKITLRAVESPLSEVIEELSRLSGENIVSRQVDARVTIDFQNVRFWQALQSICEKAGAHFEIKGPEIMVLEGIVPRLFFYGGPYVAWADFSDMLAGKAVHSLTITWEKKIWPDTLDAQLPNFHKGRFQTLAGKKKLTRNVSIQKSSRYSIALSVENLLIGPGESPSSNGTLSFSLPCKAETLEFTGPDFRESQCKKLSNGVDIYLKIYQKGGPEEIEYSIIDIGLLHTSGMEFDERLRSKFAFFQPPSVTIIDKDNNLHKLYFQEARGLTIGETWSDYGYLLGSFPAAKQSDILRVMVTFAMAPARENLKFKMPRLPFSRRELRDVREKYFKNLAGSNGDSILSTIAGLNDTSLAMHVKNYLKKPGLQKDSIYKAITVLSGLKNESEEELCLSLLASKNKSVAIAVACRVAKKYPVKVSEIFIEKLRRELDKKTPDNITDYIQILGITGAKDAVALLARCMEEFPDSQILWLYSCEALGNIPGEESTVLLRKIIRKEEDRRRLRRGLYGVEEAARAALRKRKSRFQK